MSRQTTDTLVMIRPVRFAANEQTAGSNAFQKPAALVSEPQDRALQEFEGLVAALRREGVRVLVVDDTPEPHTPDAVFPNNWFSTHEDGTVVLYPMQAENRRFERRMDIIERLRDELGLQVTRLEDLSSYETRGEYLEGTGSLVLDRLNRIAYACLSPRTHAGLLENWAGDLDYRVVAFEARDAAGRAIYHTNVMMCVGERFAVVCAESIVGAEERARVLGSLRDTGHEVVEINLAQMNAFAGNMLALENERGEKLLAMSRRAHEALREDQLRVLESHARIVSAPLNTIEDCAGGSARCMMAEIFLPVQHD